MLWTKKQRVGGAWNILLPGFLNSNVLFLTSSVVNGFLRCFFKSNPFGKPCSVVICSVSLNSMRLPIIYYTLYFFINLTLFAALLSSLLRIGNVCLDVLPLLSLSLP